MRVIKLNKKMLFAAWSCHNKFYHMYQMFYPPSRRIFKDIVTFDPQEALYKYGKESMNRRFLEVVAKEKPDYIFLWLIYDEFYFDTLLKIKEISPKTKIINFNGDEDTLFYNYSLLFFPVIDYFFITQPQFISLYKKHKKKAFLTLGAESGKYRPLDLQKIYDVTFIGTTKADRMEYVRYLMQNGIKVKVFGTGWEKYHQFRNIYGGKLSDEDFLKVINQSKINLIFSKNYEGFTHVVERVPQITMCKAFAMAEYSPGYHEIFKEDKDIATFKDKKELLSKVRYYLKNEKEREKIASNAYKKSLREVDMINLLYKAFNYIEKDKSLLHGTLPGINKKLVALTEEDFNLNNDALKKKVGSYDYIAFRKKNAEFLSHKNYLQMRALEITKKKICCCDYYLYSSLIGNYASVFSKLSYVALSEKEFLEVFDISQLMTRADYFMKNINMFRLLFKGKSEVFFRKNDLCFATLPLVAIKGKKAVDNKRTKEIFLAKFEIPILNLISQRKLYRDAYAYKLLLYGAFYNPWILRYLYAKAMPKLRKKHKLFNLLGRS